MKSQENTRNFEILQDYARSLGDFETMNWQDLV